MNTQDTNKALKERIQSCFKRNLIQTEGDTELFDTEVTIDEIQALIAEETRKAREAAGFDPYSFVEPCEPDCSPERHAYHQGQWDMATRMFNALKAKGVSTDE